MVEGTKREECTQDFHKELLKPNKYDKQTLNIARL